MPHDELVKRLRDMATSDSNIKSNYIGLSLLQAANAIEDLVGFVQEAERDRDEYRTRLDKANNAIEELSRLHEAQRQNLIALMNEEPEPKWIPVTEGNDGEV